MTLDRSRLPDPVSFFEAEGLTLIGKGRWRDARCPWHGGGSLRVNVENGAFVCMAGCDLHGGDVVAYLMRLRGLGFVEACKELGAWVDNGRPGQRTPSEPPPMTHRERLEVLAREAEIVFVVGADMHKAREISERDFERLLGAVRRIGVVRWETKWPA